MQRLILTAALAVSLTPGLASAADLSIGLAAAPTSMDPQFYVLGPNSAMARNIFDGLVNQDDHQQIRPALAVSWRTVDDTTWEFTLRSGVKFQDGSDFTAADVVASIRRVPRVAVNSPSSFAPYVKAIKDVVAVDPHTVRITTNGPDALLLNDLSRVAIMPARLLDVPSATLDGGKDVVGTGPYEFVSWLPQSQVVLARNPAYWGAAPAWDKVNFRAFSNPSARSAAMLSGDVDMIESIPPADVKTMRADPHLRIVSVAGNRVMYLDPDVSRDVSPFAKGPDGKNPLLKRDVRRAISLAINRTAIVDRIMDGEGVPAGQLVPAGYFGYVPTLQPDPYDPTEAKALLAKAGYPAGFSLTFHASNDRYPNDSSVAQAIGQMLTRIGIHTDVETMPGSVYFARASKRDFSFIMGGAAVETGEASGALGPLLETFGPGAGLGNRGRYSSPELDHDLHQARITLDPVRREALLQAAMRTGMHDLGVIPLFYLTNDWAMKTTLTYPGRSDAYTLAAEVTAAK